MSDIVEQARAYLAQSRDACAYVEDCVGAEAREWIERLCAQNEALLAREAGCIRAMGMVMAQNTANAAEVERLRGEIGVRDLADAELTDDLARLVRTLRKADA